MSAEEQDGLMESPENAANTLALEAQHYLAAVDVFHVKGCEPNGVRSAAGCPRRRAGFTGALLEVRE
jgi:hypothetical protein